MVIDHIAKPEIAKGGSPGWREDLTAIAQSPRVFCKVSGLITEANWRHWSSSDLKPYVQHVMEIFGWDRAMFGSDWPVCLLAGSYEQVWNAIHDVLGEISDERRARVFAGNAA
jgi:L-fuconolactonase